MGSLPRPRKCRHCIRMTSGSCPYPAAKSVHRMAISYGTCELAVLDPHFKGLYITAETRRWRSRACKSAFGTAEIRRDEIKCINKKQKSPRCSAPALRLRGKKTINEGGRHAV